MDDTFRISWQSKDGGWHYVTAWGVSSMKNHIDYIMSQGGHISTIKNESL